MRETHKALACAALLVGVGIAACGDDTASDSGTTSNNAASSTSANNASSNASSNAASSTAASTAASTGAGGGGGGNAAQAFCDGFDATCGYGNGYADEAACLTAYNGYDAARQQCVRDHLTNAENGNPGLHCPHAAGAAPCN